MVETAQNLTEDEVKLYDRQIRLWGVESQKRLRSARLLLIGLGGLGAETAKNVILSGVKSVTFLDHRKGSSDMSFSQFLIPPDQINENRAEASVERAKRLNPLVEITSDTSDVSELEDDYFTSTKFDVVIATGGLTTKQIIRLDNICRKNNIKFYAGEVFGLFGYFFADLQSHSYTKVVTKLLRRGQKTEETLKETLEFPTFSAAINHNFKTHPVDLRRFDPGYFILKILLKFREKMARNPTSSADDAEILMNLKDDEMNSAGAPPEKVPDDLLKLIVGPEVGPVCAIVGAVLAQEVIKAVSHKDEPHYNSFFFNPSTTKGVILKIGAE